ncbi:hypothetical protein HYY75_08330 [bacterium]|nr:hypothetical protein [bacterium]
MFFCSCTFAVNHANTQGNEPALENDIPDPPGSENELPSPIPVVQDFINGLMDGQYDKCLANFHIRTFLSILFSDQIQNLGKKEYMELYSYQIQAQRNEFRFLSRIMNRLAKGAKFYYSNPRLKNTQCKVLIKVKTTKGFQNFTVYGRYVEDQWQIYDYVINNKRYSDAFKKGMGNKKIFEYIKELRPIYGSEFKYSLINNNEFNIDLKIPEYFKVREKVSPGLLFSISAFEGQILIHVQGRMYSKPQGLKEVASQLKSTLLPLHPKLFDQWKGDIAGVDIGHIIFRFEKSGKNLFAHMVIIPLGTNLVVLNFYHNSFPLLKNFTNIRDRIIESLTLKKIEAAGTENVYIPPDDSTLPGNRTPTELAPYADKPPYENAAGPPPTDDQAINSTSDDTPPPPPEDQTEPHEDANGGENVPPPPPPPPPDSGEDGQDQAPPPPPPDGGEQNPSDLHDDQGANDNSPPPPPPDYKPPEEGGGTDVSF